MKIIKTIVFEDSDEILIRRIIEYSNMAANFFTPTTRDEQGGPDKKGGLHKVQWLRQGHPLSVDQLEQILDSINVALINVRERKPNQFFLAETKKDYEANLKWSRLTLCDWLRKVK